MVRTKLLAALVVPTIWFAKVLEVGAMATGVMPVPFNVAVCGLLLPVSVMVRVPVSAPAVRGAKLT